MLTALHGRTLVTAESCTGGGIGAALTAVPGSSQVYKGGVICYTNAVKQTVLGVAPELLERCGAVSAPVAEAMVLGVRSLLKADAGISVTGLAGPGGDDYGNPVGTVYIGSALDDRVQVRQYRFSGSREEVRQAAIRASLAQLLEMAENNRAFSVEA